MKKRISVKLFLVTALFFLVLIAAAMLFQLLLFENYYQAKKLTGFKADFQKLYAQYLKEGLGKQDGKAHDYLNEFEEKNYAKVALLNMSEGSVRILFPKTGNENTDIVFFQTQKNVITETGDKFALPIPSFASDKLSRADMVASAVFELFSDDTYRTELSELNHPIVFKSSQVDTEVKKIIGAVHLTETLEGDSYLIAVSSLQPVGEAASAIKDLYLYFSVFAVILILLPARVFSNMVSKPLVRMNRAAMKMAELDFSVKCEEKREDEIGNLAHTMNFLSENLRNSLSELKIANSKLKEDIEKERHFEKMRKEFIASVSHELKTPVSLITGYAEGLKENIVEGADRSHYLDVISDEARKIGNLVNDMLDLSQLESGSFKLNRSEFTINELLAYTLKKFTNSFQQKNLHVSCMLPEQALLVYADEFRIEQVLNNFLNNAITHTPVQGKINVRMLPMGSTVHVEMENEGSHIDDHELENIWQKFYKLDKSRNRETGGTGLGLAIVKNIMTLHKSNYGVENTQTGVKFYFELPISQS